MTGISSWQCARWVWGPGTTHLDLDQLAYDALHMGPNSNVFATAGDDNILFKNANDFFSLESDFSSFDQSQGYGVLEWQRRQFRQLFPDIAEAAAIYSESIQHAAIRVGFPPKIGGSAVLHRQTRTSGASDTTGGNTLVCAAAVFNALKYESKDSQATAATIAAHFDLSFAQLGFKAKVKAFAGRLNISSATFLKGYWLFDRVSRRYRWTPLASRILKIIKIDGPPETYFDVKTYAKPHRRYMASLLYYDALRKTWGSVPMDDLVRAWFEHVPKVTVEVRALCKQIRPIEAFPLLTSVDEPDAYELDHGPIFERYGFTYQDWRYAIEQVQHSRFGAGIPKLGVVGARLRSCDYE
jgi:predicted outer membrane lipoprotein